MRLPGFTTTSSPGAPRNPSDRVSDGPPAKIPRRDEDDPRRGNDQERSHHRLHARQDPQPRDEEDEEGDEEPRRGDNTDAEPAAKIERENDDLDEVRDDLGQRHAIRAEPPREHESRQNEEPPPEHH